MIGVSEVGMVEYVVHIGPDAKTNSLGEFECLQDAKVAVEVVRAAEEIAPSMAKRTIPTRATRAADSALKGECWIGSKTAHRLIVARAVGNAATEEARHRAVTHRITGRIPKHPRQSGVLHGEGIAGASKEGSRQCPATEHPVHSSMEMCGNLPHIIGVDTVADIIVRIAVVLRLEVEGVDGRAQRITETIGQDATIRDGVERMTVGIRHGTLPTVQSSLRYGSSQTVVVGG